MYLEIQRNSEIPMIKQVYNQIKLLILNGELKSNERLPSTRILAENLQISRIVILEAYDMLTAEGYTRSLKGSGTFVNESISIKRPAPENPNIEFSGMKENSSPISFRSGVPALDQFPREKWLKCYRNALNKLPDKDLGYDLANGYLPFRKTLAEYLFRTRGIHCHEDQIIITSGAVQGLYLLSQFFSQSKSSILIEEPTTKGLRELLDYNHSNVINHPVDHRGIDPNTLPNNPDLSCIITTPSHQYPLGGSLPISKRIELINYARKQDCYVVEDDYDSEYRYDNSPVESLYELDSQRVIYLGSFSKVLLPSIRIGYIVLPVDLIKPIYNIKSLVDIHCPTINQAGMQDFIANGYLEQHILKTKKIYKKRRLALINSLRKAFGNKIEILGSETGIHLVVEFRDIIFTDKLMERIKSAGVYIMRVSEHAISPKNHESQLIFGYGNVTESEICRGVSILHKVIMINCQK